MDRGEPTLVPEWLKGNSAATHHYQHRQHNQPSDVDNSDSCIAYRHRYSQSRSGSHDRSYDRQNFLSPRKSISNQGGSGSCDRPTFGSHTNTNTCFRRSSSFRSYESQDPGSEFSFRGRGNERRLNVGTRNESEWTLRRSQSAISSRNFEERDKRNGVDGQSFPNPLISSGLSNNLQKAFFDKNFPSLRGEERQGNIHSKTPTSSSPVSCVSPIAVEGWKSVLADAPVMNGCVSSTNGPVSFAPGNLISSKNQMVAPSTGPNMAEALTQNPSKPKTQQSSFESQRMEEWALKQSRQLIPMTPSMPKTMGLSPSEKSKLKSLKSSETTVNAKGQVPASSHPINSSRTTQGGKLLVLKSGREIGYSYSSKVNGSTPIKLGSSGNASGATADGTGNANLMNLRKKTISDQKLTTSNSTSVESICTLNKQPGTVVEEKKPLSQVQQNRSDFFKALRRKASEGSPSIVPQGLSCSCVGNNGHLSSQDSKSLQNDLLDPNEGKPFVQNIDSENEDCSKDVRDETSETSEISLNSSVSSQAKLDSKDNCDIGCVESHNRVSVKVGSEEEEAAFLRSLGWEENSDDGEELTEEEINAFYQEMRRIAAANVMRGNHRLWNLRLDMADRTNLETLHSGIGSSESA